MWGDGVDEDDEDLNENDDVEEECGIDDDNIPYLIICQFDNVILLFSFFLHCCIFLTIMDFL